VRRLLAFALAVLVSASADARVFSFAWDAGGDYPAGTTYEFNANNVSADGITDTSYSLDVPLNASRVLNAQVRAVPADGTLDPDGNLYQPSAWTTLSSIVPADQEDLNVTVHQPGGGGVMADPVFQGYSTVVNTGYPETSSLTVTFGTVTAGDLVLVLVQRDTMNYLTGVTLGGNAMTLLKTTGSDISGGFSPKVYGIIAPSSGTNVNAVASFSGTGGWGSMVGGQWSNVASATPTQSSCNDSGCADQAASSSSRTAQAITTSARRLIVAIGTDWNDYHTHTGANGFTKRFDNAVAGGGSSSVQWIYDQVADAGTFGGASNFGTASGSSDQYICALLAFEITASGGGTVTGALDSSQSANASASSALVGVSGSATKTQAGQSLGGAYGVVTGAALTYTQAGNSVSSAGGPLWTGALSVNQGANSFTSAASAYITSTVSKAQASDSATAAGTIGISATLHKTQPKNFLSFEAGVTDTANLSASPAGDSVSAEIVGSIPDWDSAFNVTQSDHSVSSVSYLGVAASVSKSQAPDTFASTGYLNDIAALTVSQAGNSATSASAVTTHSSAMVTGSSSTSSASAGVTTHSSVSATQASSSINASCSHSVVASLSKSQASNAITSVFSPLTEADFSLDATQGGDTVYTKIKGDLTRENYYFLLNRRDGTKREPMPV